MTEMQETILDIIKDGFEIRINKRWNDAVGIRLFKYYNDDPFEYEVIERTHNIKELEIMNREGIGTSIIHDSLKGMKRQLEEEEVE